MKLTTFAKVCITMFILAVCGGASWAYTQGHFDNMLQAVAAVPAKQPAPQPVQAAQPVQPVQPTQYAAPTAPAPSVREVIATTPAPAMPAMPVSKKEQVVISLDEWIGWKPIFDANGGLETTPNSIFGQLGLNVKLVVINDAVQSSNALISNNIAAAGYTLNRLAYLMDKFDRANTKIVVPFLCNNSAGGDGIIATRNIKSVEDLKGKKIVAPRFSEAQTLVYWFLANSNLSQAEMSAIAKDMILVNTPDEAAKVFFAGKADAAATWQPYLDQANDPNANSHTLITTKQATNLILDVLVFRKDFYETHKEWVAKFADGVFQAHQLYTTQFQSVRGMPMLNGVSDSEIAGMAGDAALANYAKNISSLEPGGVGPKVFQDMLVIWKRIGEPAKIGSYAEIFDISALKLLEAKYGATTVPAVSFTQEQRQAVSTKPAMLTRSLAIEFEINSAVFKKPQEAQAALDDIINQLSVVDNAIVQIEGNTSSEGARQLNVDLSYRRANAVFKYLVRYGIAPDRFNIIGNGPDKPVADNATQAGREKNRRTDVMLKAAE